MQNAKLILRYLTGKKRQMKDYINITSPVKLDLNHYSSGIYILEVNTDEHVETHKIIKN